MRIDSPFNNSSSSAPHSRRSNSAKLISVVVAMNSIIARESAAAAEHCQGAPWHRNLRHRNSEISSNGISTPGRRSVWMERVSMRLPDASNTTGVPLDGVEQPDFRRPVGQVYGNLAIETGSRIVLGHHLEDDQRRAYVVAVARLAGVREADIGPEPGSRLAGKVVPHFHMHPAELVRPDSIAAGAPPPISAVRKAARN